MGILTLTSENPQFSFVINKNPASFPAHGDAVSKTIRKGVSYGYFLNDNAFRVLFKDHPSQVSFPINMEQTEFEYLDTGRYANPELIISIITNWFSTASKSQNELDTSAKTQLETIVFIKPGSYFDMVQRHFAEVKGFKVDFQNIGGWTWKIVVESDSVYLTLNAAIAVASTIRFNNWRDEYLPDHSESMRIARSFAAIGSPYFLTYLFKKFAFRSKNLYDTDAAPLLNTESITFKFGDTFSARRDRIRDELRNDPSRAEHVFELGCGEGKYTFLLQRLYKHVFAFDQDDEMVEKVTGKAQARNLGDKITVGGEITSDIIQDWATHGTIKDQDIVATEMIEHVEKDIANSMLTDILAAGPRRVIITVPNATFNKHYLVDGFRHPDHYWEPTFEEFQEFINCTLERVPGYTATYDHLGDVIVEDGKTVTPTIFLSITKDA